MTEVGVDGDSPKNRWKTPLALIDALGGFDLDPCAASDEPLRCAGSAFTVADDGLGQQWRGRVWCNPPYGKYAKNWLLRCADHGDAIAIVPPRSLGAKWFQDMVHRSQCSLFFIRGRVAFIDPSTGDPVRGNTADSVLLIWGASNVEAVAKSGIAGLMLNYKPGETV